MDQSRHELFEKPVNASRSSPDPASRRQLWALIIVTLGVMILGILVVAAPDRFGVPRPAPTVVATPTATE